MAVTIRFTEVVDLEYRSLKTWGDTLQDSPDIINEAWSLPAIVFIVLAPGCVTEAAGQLNSSLVAKVDQERMEGFSTEEDANGTSAPRFKLHDAGHKGYGTIQTLGRGFKELRKTLR